MTDSERFVLSMFSKCVGDRFRICCHSGETHTVTLIEATGRAEKKDGEVREDARNFSLVFVDAAGTVDSHLPQATYRFEHDELGSLELFIVPIGPGLDGDRMRYEAVFTSSP